MEVLVTGGAGYIGSVCVERLLDCGYTVAVYDDLSEGHRSAVDPRARFIDARSAPADLAGMLREARTDAVLHFAANALVGESMVNPEKYFRNNVSNALRILDASRQAGVRKFVFSSTCAVYGLAQQMPITEETPQRPVNPYGESKLMFEKILRWYQCIYGLEFVSLRYFNAAGASQRFGEHHRRETHLIPNILRIPLGQATECQIYGTDYDTPDGTCIRDYIHVVDLADAHMLALGQGIQGFFNLGNGDGYSVREVIRTCEEVTGQAIKAVEKPRRPGDPARLVAAADKARQELGWQPKFPKLSQIIDSAWRWHQAHPHGYPD